MVRYLYIDGASLRGYAQNVLQEFFGKGEATFDLGSLAKNFERAFYYDGFPSQEPGESEEAYLERTATQRAIIDGAAQVDRLHVYEGDVRRRNRKRGREQKMVDVMLAVDMMRHANRNILQEATILTGDQDFTPLVKAVVDEGVHVTVYYPRNETSPELLRAADYRKPITLPDLWSHFSPATKVEFAAPRFDHRSEMGEIEGSLVHAWEHGDDVGGIFPRPKCELWRQRDEWLFKATINSSNQYTGRHPNLRLLAAFVPDSVADLTIPAAVLEAAEGAVATFATKHTI